MILSFIQGKNKRDKSCLLEKNEKEKKEKKERRGAVSRSEYFLYFSSRNK